jgi:hypothetical protein
MIFRGNLGFDPAASAGIVNGEIILSANYNVNGRLVDGGSIADGVSANFGNNTELSTTRADIFLEDFTATSSLLAISTHRTQVTAFNAGSSVTGNLLMVGRESAELTASNGQNFTITGDGSPALVLDHESLKPEKTDADVAAQFSHLDRSRGDCLVACGWVMAEELLKHG